MTKCWGWLLVIQISIAGSAIAQTGSDQPSADQPWPGTDPGSMRQPQPASDPKPLSLFATVSKGLASNINFDDDEIRSIGLVLGGGAQYVGDDFEVRYELTGHSYTNTSRWDRLSQRIEAAFERDLPDQAVYVPDGRGRGRGRPASRSPLGTLDQVGAIARPQI